MSDDLARAQTAMDLIMARNEIGKLQMELEHASSSAYYDGERDGRLTAEFDHRAEIVRLQAIEAAAELAVEKMESGKHYDAEEILRDSFDNSFLCGNGWLGLASAWPSYPFDAEDPACCRTCARMANRSGVPSEHHNQGETQ